MRPPRTPGRPARSDGPKPPATDAATVAAVEAAILALVARKRYPSVYDVQDAVPSAADQTVMKARARLTKAGRISLKGLPRPRGLLCHTRKEQAEAASRLEAVRRAKHLGCADDLRGQERVRAYRLAMD